ncbi:hypothetical protein LVJ94_17460 [Pendulispora rubella]|uniref:Carboxypeptidase regulatory-like domain-containing protein n=1 Tax=Pendulispora rubella TaxID=2741070 RepID=A0ABZ2LDJ9_9BACT
MHFVRVRGGRDGAWEVYGLPGGEDYRVTLVRTGHRHDAEPYPWTGERSMESICLWGLGGAARPAEASAVSVLLEIHRAVRPTVPAVRAYDILRAPAHRDLQRITKDLRDAVRFGDLRVERLPSKRIALNRDKPPSVKPPPAPVTEEWIGIRVVDQEGRPMPGVKYRLKLPSGSVIEGEVGADGKVHLDGLSAGQCSIELHELDKRTWTIG